MPNLDPQYRKAMQELGVHLILNASGDSDYPKDEKPASPEKSTPKTPTKLRLSTGKRSTPSSRNASCSSFEIKRRKNLFNSTPAGPHYFDQLSDEMIIQIFKWLPKSILVKLALTCKRFNRIFKDEAFWKRVDVTGRTLFPGTIGQIMARGTNLLRAARSVVYSPLLSNSFGPTFSASGCKLEYLDLSSVTMSTRDLHAMLSRCQNLRKLSLENVDITHDICIDISQNFVLNTLHLGMTKGCTALGLKAILRNCKQLRELNLAWAGLDHLAVTNAVENLHPNIERLNISGCREVLQDSHVGILVTTATNLQELDISDATVLSNISLAYITKLEKLEVLSTSRCYNIIPVKYLELSLCKSLRYLNGYGNWKPEALRELASRLDTIEINKFPFSSIARPTVGVRRTSIWGLKARE